MKVVALDPGGTTGWAVYCDEVAERDAKRAHSPQLFLPGFYCGEFRKSNHHEELFDWLAFEHTHDTTVVCESFEFRQNRQRDNINLMSKEYIGVTKLFGQTHAVPVVFQTAALGKGFVTDQKLKAMSLWSPGNKHAMDAMRHLVYFLINKKGRTDLVTLWQNL